MREGRYAVIFKFGPKSTPHSKRRPAGGAWFYSATLPSQKPRLHTYEGALKALEHAKSMSPALLYDVKRMA